MEWCASDSEFLSLRSSATGAHIRDPNHLLKYDAKVTQEKPQNYSHVVRGRHGRQIDVHDGYEGMI